jgi:uncharacterized protein (TIGR03435 family)
LTGKYTFKLECLCEGCSAPPGISQAAGLASADSAAPTVPAEPSIFAALEAQLGLKLEKVQNVPVEVIVVDRVDKVPTDN